MQLLGHPHCDKHRVHLSHHPHLLSRLSEKKGMSSINEISPVSPSHLFKIREFLGCSMLVRSSMSTKITLVMSRPSLDKSFTCTPSVYLVESL